MDLTIIGHSKKSPESDTDAETPLQISHLTKALSLSSGLKRGSGCQHQLPQQKMGVVSYKECLKNHAANLGGLALDGCGEFMPSPTASPLDPNSLKCVACGCHRNFHRRDPYGSGGSPITTITTTTTTHRPPLALHWTSSPSPGPVSSSAPSSDPSSSPASPTPQNSLHPSAPHILWSFSTSQSGPLNENHPQSSSFYPTVTNPNGRKRARTKFTQEQKEKMYAFAERLGWKLQRGIDERSVEVFCSEVGVKRNVFKVWMHNNKHRRENSNNNKEVGGVNGNGDRVGLDNSASYNRINNNNNNNFDNFDDDHQISIQVSPSSP